jgi:hypothetical protein
MSGGFELSRDQLAGFEGNNDDEKLDENDSVASVDEEDAGEKDSDEQNEQQDVDTVPDDMVQTQEMSVEEEKKEELHVDNAANGDRYAKKGDAEVEEKVTQPEHCQ